MVRVSNTGKRRNRAWLSLWPRLENLEPRVVLSTFRVNTTLDTVAVNLKTGKDAAGHVSLRSAIQAANARPNADTILLAQGNNHAHDRGSRMAENDGLTGDLDIDRNLTIKGKSATKSLVDAADELIESLQVTQ